MEDIVYEKNILETLKKIVCLIDIKDSYTKMHSENVTKYALLLGKQLNLEEEDLKIIEIGAMLHDVGKIGIPDYLLTKNSCLTDSEFNLIKNHVVIGESLLPIEGYEKVKMMIRSHHERIDGKGYPDGLKSSQIPYLARILSVVDTFDAMTTQRSYNKIKTLDEAFNELIRVSKKYLNLTDEFICQLDPYIVTTFIKMVKSNDELMEEFNKKDLEIIDNRSKIMIQK